MLYRNALYALALFSFSGCALAVEIGFYGLATATASDNIAGANVGAEVEGSSGFAQFGVFAEQKGTNVRGAFNGEMNGTRRLDDPDAETAVVTKFLGAAEWDVTPRSLTWYVGNVLGGIQADDALQIDDALEIDGDQNIIQRRNVFVTGPEFTYELDTFSRVNARLLYVNQSQNGLDLESLYTANASWQLATDSGNTWGFVVSDVFTDSPEVDVENNPDFTQEGDFNRFSLSGTWNRERGAFSYGAELGGTRYDTEIDSLDGVNAQFSFARRLGPATSLSFRLSRDLQDQTLTAIETLIADGTGIQVSGDGFFDETTATLSYSYASPATAISFSVGAGEADFRLVAGTAGLATDGDAQDRNNVYASASYGRTFTSRSDLQSTLRYQSQRYVNLQNESQSVSATVQFNHQVSRSFTVQIGYSGVMSEGESDLVVDGIFEGRAFTDVTQNRVVLGLVWAPPTRASQELTVELKSLLQ